MFKRAQRTQAKLKIALSGPSGSGKTWTALSIATGMIEALGGGKIAVVDTENNSASLYSDRFTFDCAAMNQPYLTQKYITAIDAAEKAGYTVLIVDSTTHQWAEMLNRKAALDARDKSSSFYNWSQLTPEHEAFKAKIVSANIHLICTMRSKQDYAQEKDDKGRTVIQKVGLAPVQRENFDYEFTTALDLSQSHHAIASKDRTGLFSTTIPFVPSKETGIQLIQWLNHPQTTENVPEINQVQAS